MLSLLDIVIVSVTAIVLFLAVSYLTRRKRKNEPPTVPYLIPWVGSIVGFGKNPTQFVLDNAAKYGDVFTATVFGKNLTFITHPKAFDVFFKAHDSELEQREVYKFMTPVFGKGVVYDAESTDRMMEQLKFVTSGLTTTRFKLFVDIFEDEVERKIAQMGDSGECDMFWTLADMIIFTASRCLLGEDIRRYLETKNLGRLYHDLDEGISPLSFFFPNLPQKQRDHARGKVGEIFQELIDTRRQNPEKRYDDVLDTLLNNEYKSGEPVPDSHIIGILIAGLFAGQHTSSIASFWTLMNIVNDKELTKRIVEEQERIIGNSSVKLEYEKVMQMDLLERSMQEALRMYPPLIMLMRYAKKNRKYNDLVIPKGNILIVSTSAAGRCPDVYTNPDKFDPDRFADPRREHEKVRHGYLAFGSGRHKCIGENFAVLQVKSILSKMFRTFEFEIVGDLPKVSYSSLVVGPAPPCTVRYTRRK
jgi:sterol 14-demethylase